MAAFHDSGGDKHLRRDQHDRCHGPDDLAVRSLTECDLDGAVALSAEARRNQTADDWQLLLDGALEGIRNVANRLADLRRLRHSFDTYDSRGRKSTIEGHVVRHVEKRA